MSDEQRTEREARGQCPDADCVACRFSRLFDEVVEEDPRVRLLFAGMFRAAASALVRSVAEGGGGDGG